MLSLQRRPLKGSQLFHGAGYGASKNNDVKTQGLGRRVWMPANTPFREGLTYNLT